MQHKCPTCGSLSEWPFTQQDDPRLFLTLRGTELTLSELDFTSTMQVAIEPPKGERLFPWLRAFARILRQQKKALSQSTSSSGPGDQSSLSKKQSRELRNVPGSGVFPLTYSGTQPPSGWRKVE